MNSAGGTLLWMGDMDHKDTSCSNSLLFASDSDAALKAVL